MKTWIGLAVLATLFAGVPDAAEGQSPVADTVFVGTHHSPWTSGLLELGFPTAGFAYAGDWSRGFLPNALRIGSIIALGVDEEPCEEACEAWALAYLGATIWAMIGAVNTAHDHNAAVREPGRFVFEPSPRGGVSVGFRWGH